MPLTPGSRLGPYEIVAPLGAGGMGEVYRARDPRLGREVAVRHPLAAPDGSAVLAARSDGAFALFPTDGGPSRVIPGLEPDERPSMFTSDGTHVYTFRRGVIPAPVSRVDVASGHREPWLEIEPVTRNGTDSAVSVLFTPDGERFLASFGQYVNDLFVVSDLR